MVVKNNDDWNKKEFYVMKTLKRIEDKMDEQSNKIIELDKKLIGFKTKLAGVVIVVSSIVSIALKQLLE